MRACFDSTDLGEIDVALVNKKFQRWSTIGRAALMSIPWGFWNPLYNKIASRVAA